MPHHRSTQYVSDEDDDDDEGTVVYSRTSSSTCLRSRFTVTKICEPKTITTAPGFLGAGETETESEDQPVRLCIDSNVAIPIIRPQLRQLPTARIIPSSGPLIPPTTMQQRLTPLLFSFSRWLSIVPAFFGTLYNIFCAVSSPQQAGHKIDFIVSILWVRHRCILPCLLSC